MAETFPPFVLNRLFTLDFNNQPIPGRGLVRISNEHRPYICYGVSSVTFNPGLGISLRSAPNGTGLPSAGGPAFLTLKEWATLDDRFSRVPLSCADPALNPGPSAGQFAAFPVFTVRPFLVDLAASYVEVPLTAREKVPVVCLELALVPADAANLRAAGLRPPAASLSPRNRLSR